MSRSGTAPRFWTSVAVRTRTATGRGIISVLRRARLNLQHKLALLIGWVQRLRYRVELRRYPAAVIDRGHPVPAGFVERLQFDTHRQHLVHDLVTAVQAHGGVVRPITAHWHHPITLAVDHLDQDQLWRVLGTLSDDHPGLVVQRYDPDRDPGRAADRSLAGFVLGPAIRNVLLPDRALSRPWVPAGRRPAELAGASWQVTEHAIDATTGRHLGGPAAVRLILDVTAAPNEPALVTEPVDIVYTWVDSADPDWQRDYDAAKPGERQTQAAATPARFRQYDELRFSLRSIAEFAPWARRIWIVTNGQVPSWFAGVGDGRTTADGRVSIVPHADLWRGEDGLPTFNSQAIEACLHRIDGLSEKFIYFNDDFFLGRPVSPEMFFRPGTGRPVVFPSNQTVPPGPPDPHDLAPDASGKNNRMMIATATGRLIDHKYLHVPQALSRPVLEELERQFPEAFAETRRATFRSLSDLAACSLHHGYGLATGQAERGRIIQRYVDVEGRACARDLADIARYRCYDAFCLNAIREEGDEQVISDFLHRYFPVAAPWESDPADGEGRTA
ncbi:stealth family protein [Microlunatus speluncae]|uniref:stealth family protein n=1 Tax=Microlunatus speluncae TaxID=2594267 RepID=UPI001375C6E6|nr:stealth family protein [Microlunatus speluncae]